MINPHYLKSLEARTREAQVSSMYSARDAQGADLEVTFYLVLFIAAVCLTSIILG